jgi:hypothetical protein
VVFREEGMGRCGGGDGVGVGWSGADAGVELGAGNSNGPIAWAAVDGGKGGSVEVGGEEIGLGAGVGEE